MSYGVSFVRILKKADRVIVAKHCMLFFFISDSYDSLTLIGVIAAGAVSHECFPEIIRIVKPG